MQKIHLGCKKSHGQHFQDPERLTFVQRLVQVWSEEWRKDSHFQVKEQYYLRSNKSSCLTVSFLFTVRVHSYSHIRIHGISMIFMNAACLVPSYRNAVQSQFWLNSVSASSALIFKYAFLFLSALLTPLAYFQPHTSQQRRPHGRVQNVLLRHSFHNNFRLVLLVVKKILNLCFLL